MKEKIACRNCDNVIPMGPGKTSCKITGKTIMDFDKECEILTKGESENE